MVIIRIADTIRLMRIDCRTWSDHDIPQWLLDYRATITGTLYYRQLTYGGHVHLLPLTNDITHVDKAIIGLVSDMNADVTLGVHKLFQSGDDGREVVHNSATINIGVRSRGYALLHDGKDSLLIYYGERLPERRILKRTDMLVQ